MRKRTWIIGAAVAGLALGGATVAAAAVNPFDDDETTDGSTQSPLSQTDRDKAIQAALAKVGQGTVTEVERDENPASAYEVEVRLADGSEVEVAVGSDFKVLSQQSDD
ncbi:PepSY domain-containing protein [Arthrobacter sp. ISL-28]|uniref:PepSY domain-containing protein n=1 Tax=Arthrobacter sp. ISL-28 TaxID=2819108 RepID=UPI001BE8BC8F|nr:PepSY domain-containing protein [Arthrobacter sp. ISL-28]MBT2521942.1 PepSY domain-containing protein [Arthrobacter sp. ISL-28]